MNRHYLSWFDPDKKQYSSAGVAFYDEKYGEYELRIDSLQGKYFLKAIGTNNNKIQYRVEIFKNHRYPVGQGTTKDGDIFMDIPPYNTSLVLHQ